MPLNLFFQSQQQQQHHQQVILIPGITKTESTDSTIDAKPCKKRIRLAPADDDMNRAISPVLPAQDTSVEQSSFSRPDRRNSNSSNSSSTSSNSIWRNLPDGDMMHRRRTSSSSSSLSSSSGFNYMCGGDDLMSIHRCNAFEEDDNGDEC